MQLVTEHVEQGELRLAQKLDRRAIDGGLDVMLAHWVFPARS
jgi:hypothetical protein